MRNTSAEDRPFVIDRAYAVQIVQIVQRHLKAPLGYMASRARQPRAVYQRYCTIWAVHRLITRTTKQIAKLVGPHHTVVFHAIRQIESQRSVYPEIKKETDALLDACARALGSCPHCGCCLTTKIAHEP